MLRRLKSWLNRRRFERLIEPFDKRIAAARRKHEPVRHIVAEKRAFVHASLKVAR